MDCRDCYHCKINIPNQTLRCSECWWVYENGNDHTIQLNENEVQVHDIKIHDRKIFKTSELCGQLPECSMED